MFRNEKIVLKTFLGGCIKRQPNANQKKTYANAQGTRAIAEFCKMEP